MKYLQNLLLLIGNTVLYALALGFGLMLLGWFTLFRPSPTTHGTAAWGSAYGAIACLLLGSLIGTVAGFAHAVALIFRDEVGDWHWPTWLGIAVGAVAAVPLLMLISAVFPGGILAELLVEFPPGCLATMIATATLGGYAGSLANALWLPVRRRAKKSNR